ncbi:Uu.00g014890.m01.CDS01 [Anthostomella pinea]|uniref:Uu.00g014890.m01.CDS01 n=1 Tax=Anthostomella pinea TaxID=933095 RepID=A0AAI8YQE8_9PEZI|nr:Uu.00g014890.m01.CDS01 [Anthostomella pinea]
MDSLIEVDVSDQSAGPALSVGTQRDRIAPGVDLLFDGAIHDESALTNCPLLVPGAYDQPASSASGALSEPQQLGTDEQQLGTGEQSTALVPADDDDDAMTRVNDHQENGVQPLGQHSAHHEDRLVPAAKDTTDEPAAVYFTTSSAKLVGVAVRTWRHNSRAIQGEHGRRPVIANFIVSHNPDSALGVIEAAYRDMRSASSRCTIELRSTPNGGSYLRIAAPTKADADELIETTRLQVEDLIADRPNLTKGLFVEPPSATGPDFVIVLDATSGGARHRLELRDGTRPNVRLEELAAEHEKALSSTLFDALNKAGRLRAALNLKIHLGHYMLQRYQKTIPAFQFEQFEAMVKNSRASGRLRTHIGDEALAGAMLRVIRAPHSPFLPTDNQTPSAADVAPQYAFEACSEEVRFETELEPTHASHASGGDGVRYRMVRTRAFPLNATISELDITNISMGSKLDWKVEAVAEDRDEKKFHGVNAYFQSGKIHMQGPHGGCNAYPRIWLACDSAMAGYFKSATVKSVYRFNWKETAYIVELAINRQWDGIRSMVANKPPTVDFGLSVYGEAWDEEMQLLGGRSASHVWGKDLKGLFAAEGNSQTGEGVGRVRGFLQTVRNIRDAFEGVEG